MHAFFRSLQTGISKAVEKSKAWVQEHRALSLVGVLALIFLVLPQIGHAGFFDWVDTNSAAQSAFNLIIAIIASVVQFLGHVFVYIVDIFLGFARYNGFADAQPVKLGWVIVRDICNMFFIVVLLISAFSTIIGYDSSLRYNAVVPKLLLMAILINFSRTLIQVLIDFSQVVMLTFVNAFRAAGAGNFTAAFRINDLLSMRDDVQAASTAGGGVTSLDQQHFDLMVQIFGSFLLALVLIIIANGVMIIMVAYILARIIGLWVALIFSPAAFLVTALPGKLAGGLSSFSGKYWSRLTGMLTGGPVVMFFIYLTFAILQTPAAATPPTAPPAGQAASGQAATPAATTGSGLSSQLGLYQPTPEINAAGATQFLTNVGTSDNIASFIVAVALMLMALEAAVEAANAVDSTVGKFAGQVGSASKGLAFGAAALAASTPWLATKFGYRAIDKRYDITGKASNVGLRLANKIPIVGQYARKPLMAGMMMRKREAAAEEKELMGATSGMTADQKRVVQAGLQSTPGAILGNLADKVIGALPENGRGQQVLGSLRKNLGGAWLSQGDKRAMMALSGDLAGEGTASEDQRNLEGEIEAQVLREEVALKAANPAYVGRSKSEIGKIVENRAADTVRQRRAEQLDVQEAQAKSMNDHATLDSIKAMRKKDPLLWTSASKRREKIGDIDPDGLPKVDESVRGTTDFLASYALGHGGVELKDGNLVASDDKILRDRLIEDIAKHDKKTAKLMEAFIQHLQNSSTTDPKTGVTKAGLAESIATQGRMETDGNGDIRFARTPGAGASVLRKGANMVENATRGFVKLPLMGRAEGISLMGEGGMKELTEATGGAGGRILRNTNEAAALDALKTHAVNGTMGQAAAAGDLSKFLRAGGSVADLKAVDHVGDAFAQLGQDLAGKFAAVLTNNNNALEVNPAQRQQYQELLKSLSFLKQLNNPGTDGKVAEPIFRAMASNMTVGGEAFRLGDIFAFKNTAPAGKRVLGEDPGFALLSAAKRANEGEALKVLERALEVQGHTEKAMRDRLSSSAGRALSLESDT